jgi:hypothetical protein
MERVRIDVCVCAIENPREAPVVHITPAPPTRELYRPPALGQAAAPVLSHQVPATFPASADDEARLLPTVPLCVSHTDHRDMYAHVHICVYVRAATRRRCASATARASRSGSWTIS